MSNTAQDQTKVRYFFLFFVRNLGGSHFLSLRAVSRKNIYAAILLYLVSCIPFMLSLLYLERRYRRILSMAYLWLGCRKQPQSRRHRRQRRRVVLLGESHCELATRPMAADQQAGAHPPCHPIPND